MGHTHCHKHRVRVTAYILLREKNILIKITFSMLNSTKVPETKTTLKK